MPTYEYECTKCGKLFELFQSISAKPKTTIATSCTECRNKAPVVRRISGGAGVIFRGSGFYQTDYRSESYKKAAKAESESASGKTKTEGDAKPQKPETPKPSTSSE
jgi:putative FmdB family regulatory protein